MKIAYIAHKVSKRFGPPSCVAALVERFCDEHEVSVFSAVVRDIDRKKVKLYKLPAIGGSRILGYVSLFISSNITLTVGSLLWKNDFDIIHSTGSDGAIFANITTSHFCEREDRRVLGSRVTREPFGTISQKLRAIDYYLYRRLVVFIEKLIFGRNSSKLRIVVSERMKRDFIRHYGSAAEDILVIPNGVDCQRFTPHNKVLYRDSIRKKHGISSEDVMLLFVGGDWERKGLPYLIEAVSLISRQDVKLLVVGRGDASFYEGRARNKGINERMVFVGHSASIWEYYGAADILILPTLYEPFGLVITEAMASGLPVITSRAAGAADLITDGIDGFLMDDPTDATDLAAKINLLLSDAKLRSDIGKKARLTAERASWDEIAKRTLEVYNTLINSKKMGRI